MNPADFIQQLSASVAQNPVLALLVAAAGGALSTSVCPCTLPTGLGLVSWVGGASSDAAALPVASSAARSRPVVRRGLLSLLFFAGLVVSLTTLGTIAAVAGQVFTGDAPAFSVLAGIVLGMVGTATLAGPWVRRRLPDPVVRQRGGLVGAFGYGIAYSVATITSSAGPLLLVLTIAAAVGRPWYGASLSLAFAIGRGLPFLGLGYSAEVGTRRLQPWLSRLDRSRRAVEVASGIALSGLAVYFLWLATVLSSTP